MIWLTLFLVSLFLVWTSYLGLLKPYLAKREFRAWLNRPRVKQSLATLTKLYEKVDAMAVAREAWQQPKFNDYAFIYGEIDCISFIAILETLNPSPEDVFYDLGSGSGKAVFTAALSFDFAACKGIELVPELYVLSCKLQANLPTIATPIEFINADFMQVDLTEATLIFINAACYVGETWAALVNKLLQLKPGTRIILASKQLPQPQFSLLQTELRYMSWGTTQVNLYQKN